MVTTWMYIHVHVGDLFSVFTQTLPLSFSLFIVIILDDDHTKYFSSYTISNGNTSTIRFISVPMVCTHGVYPWCVPMVGMFNVQDPYQPDRIISPYSVK